MNQLHPVKPIKPRISAKEKKHRAEAAAKRDAILAAGLTPAPEGMTHILHQPHGGHIPVRIDVDPRPVPSHITGYTRTLEERVYITDMRNHVVAIIDPSRFSDTLMFTLPPNGTLDGTYRPAGKHLTPCTQQEAVAVWRNGDNGPEVAYAAAVRRVLSNKQAVFAIHKSLTDGEVYSITHIPSGLAFPRYGGHDYYKECPVSPDEGSQAQFRRAVAMLDALQGESVAVQEAALAPIPQNSKNFTPAQQRLARIWATMNRGEQVPF